MSRSSEKSDGLAFYSCGIIGGDDMNVIIFNSLVVFVLFATLLMGVGLIVLAIKLDIEEKEQQLKDLEETRKSKFNDLWEQSTLK